MTPIEVVTFAAIGIAVAVAIGLFLEAQNRHQEGPAARALAGGDFAAAIAAVPGSAANSTATRAERQAAAVAAKHLLALDDAAARLDSLLAEESDDAVAALERGLVAAYAGDHAAARQFWLRTTSRPDLGEALALHQAWTDLDAGDTASALRRFEEVAAPIESKLRIDLGSGDPEFVEWFLQAAALWRAAGQTDKAAWAFQEALASAPASRLPDRIYAAPARFGGAGAG